MQEHQEPQMENIPKNKLPEWLNTKMEAEAKKKL
jgi:hypothetical protein